MNIFKNDYDSHLSLIDICRFLPGCYKLNSLLIRRLSMKKISSSLRSRFDNGIRFLLKNMNYKQTQVTSIIGRLSTFTSCQLSWIVIMVWLIYSALLLWHFKDQTNLNISMCKATR